MDKLAPNCVLIDFTALNFVIGSTIKFDIASKGIKCITFSDPSFPKSPHAENRIIRFSKIPHHRIKNPRANADLFTNKPRNKHRLKKPTSFTK